MQLFPIGKVYNFMGHLRLMLVFSVLATVASVYLVFIQGPRLGTDFVGGTEIEVAFTGAVTDQQIRSAVQDAGFSQPDVIRVTDTAKQHQFLIRVHEVSTISPEQKLQIEKQLCFGEGLDAAVCPEEKQATEVKFSPGGDKISVRYRSAPDLSELKTKLSTLDSIALREGQENPVLQNPRDHKVEVLLKSRGDQLMDGLRAQLGADVVPAAAERVEWIGPKAGAQLRDSALKATLISLIGVMVYVAFRFDVRFAPGAVISLAHDAFLTVGVLVLMGKELNLSTVAAILTIVGYSCNDTVVVYDRVRENLGRLRGMTFPQVINVSMSETLSRTALTAGTTIFSLLAFFFWGTGTLKDFSLTIIIGLVWGTYSSIYIALPVTDWFDRYFFANFARTQRKRPVVRKKTETAVL